VNKYREGKLKSTLKRESKDRETAQSISQWRLEGCLQGSAQLLPLGVLARLVYGGCSYWYGEVQERRKWFFMSKSPPHGGG